MELMQVLTLLSTLGAIGYGVWYFLDEKKKKAEANKPDIFANFKRPVEADPNAPASCYPPLPKDLWPKTVAAKPKAAKPAEETSPAASSSPKGKEVKKTTTVVTKRVCDVCSKEDAKACSRCKLTAYCSSECQKKHWPTHKAACSKEAKRINEAKAAAAAAALAGGGAVPPAHMQMGPDGAKIPQGHMMGMDGAGAPGGPGGPPQQRHPRNAEEARQMMQERQHQISVYLNKSVHGAETARASGDKKTEMQCLIDSSKAYMELGKVDEALSALEACKKLAAEEGYDDKEADALTMISQILMTQGKHAKAVESAKSSLAITKKRDVPKATGWAYFNLGSAYMANKQLDLAVECFEKSNEICLECSEMQGQLVALEMMTHCYEELKRTKDATKTVEKIFATIEKFGDPLAEAQIVSKLGVNFGRRANHLKAIVCFDKALGLCRKSKDAQGEAVNLGMLAAARLANEELEESVLLYKQQVALIAKFGDQRAVEQIMQRIQIIQHAIDTGTKPQLGPAQQGHTPGQC